MLTEEAYQLTQFLKLMVEFFLGALSSKPTKDTTAAFKTIYSSNDLNCDTLQNNPLVLTYAGTDKSQTGHELIMKLKDSLCCSLNLSISLQIIITKQKHYKLKT